MKVKSISYFGDDGWENSITFAYTKSEEIHIPRKGDTIKNKFCNEYEVTKVTWNLPTDGIVIDCKKIDK